MNSQEMKKACEDFLSTSCSEDDMNFTLNIEKFINEHKEDITILKKEMEVLSSTKNNKEEGAAEEDKDKNDQDKRFKAFYTLVVLCRKAKNLSEMEVLLDKHKEFSEKPLYLNAKGYVLKNRLTKKDMTEGLAYISRAIKIIEKNEEKNPGYYQSYADAIALGFENNLLSDREMLKKGIENIERAIQINPNYAKYYYTKGRLQIQNGQYDEAKQNILKAIDIEDDTHQDYSLRISTYQDALLRCSIAKTMADYEKSKEEMMEEIKRSRNSVIEFIGLFAAIIALIITSVEIGIKCTVQDSIRLIGFLIGGCIILTGSFRLVLQFDKKAFLQMLVFVLLGATYIAISVLVLPRFL